jgi:hypothetical protein
MSERVIIAVRREGIAERSRAEPGGAERSGASG